MKTFVALLLLSGFGAGAAEKPAAEKAPAATFSFQFKNAPVGEVIQYYSKISGQRFVIDANANGRITILNPVKVTVEDGFNLLSTALMANSLAISDHDGTFFVSQARNIQRNRIPVVTELPPSKPEKMVSWIIDLKNGNGNAMMKELRMLTSKDGEVMSYGEKRLVIQDWLSNLYRVRDVLAQLDQPDVYKPEKREKGKAETGG